MQESVPGAKRWLQLGPMERPDGGFGGGLGAGLGAGALAAGAAAGLVDGLGVPSVPCHFTLKLQRLEGLFPLDGLPPSSRSACSK